MPLRRLDSERGIALTLAIIVLMLLVGAAGFALTVSYNQKRLTDATSVTRVRAYYWAQAGVVDAYWRIRTNTLTNPAITGTGSPANFTNPNFDPDPYSLDVDSTHPGNEVTVNIGPEVNGLRSVDATGTGS